ncbi:MAG: hypothetical protein ACFHXK_12825 [bacterium]
MSLRWQLSWVLLFACSGAAAELAEKPVYGGLGIEFGRPLTMQVYGAEVNIVPERALPANLTLTLPPQQPGSTSPWRLFTQANLPRPYRDTSSRSFVMLNERAEPMRVISRIDERGCGQNFDWLKSTLGKKYDVTGEIEITALVPYERALRIRFLSRQIDVRCGPLTVIEYLDGEALAAWAAEQQQQFDAYQRELADIEERRLVMNQRRAIRFADSFTVGDEYRLEGAFGIQFQKPFAKNSTQVFPIDAPFYAVLPNLPEPFNQGDIQLVISPERHPIVIRGTFRDVAFDAVADAFKAKYGQPMKASSRHIIHRVSSNHAIVKKLSEDAVEIAFIDTVAQSEQRKRLWAEESDGL